MIVPFLRTHSRRHSAYFYGRCTVGRYFNPPRSLILPIRSSRFVCVGRSFSFYMKIAFIYPPTEKLKMFLEIDIFLKKFSNKKQPSEIDRRAALNCQIFSFSVMFLPTLFSDLFGRTPLQLHKLLNHLHSQ